MKAPFPWFGGKSRAADIVWRALGPDVSNYIEPFAGSLAVLLARPGGAGKIETVNDRDRMIANFWRALQADPEAVAHHADWPVNEADLHARHCWLAGHLRADSDFTRAMHTDPDHYDAKIAGWWVWGICQWIGSGWCVETGEGEGATLSRKRPHLNGRDTGVGVHSSRLSQNLPHLSNAGRGVHRMPEHLPKLGVVDGCASIGGVHTSALTQRLPSLGNDRGLHGTSAPPALGWFLELQERLRRVRVACGDWSRVLGDSVLGKGKNVGGRRHCAVFLDPPYAYDLRTADLYSVDDGSVSAAVRKWAIEHGDDPDLRIALCGYEGEHEMPDGWTAQTWKARRGYASDANENRKLERIWFSRHCLSVDSQLSLLGAR